MMKGLRNDAQLVLLKLVLKSSLTFTSTSKLNAGYCVPEIHTLYGDTDRLPIV